MARTSSQHTTFLPIGEGKSEVFLISLSDKEISELLPLMVVQAGYCTTPWATIHITVMQAAPSGAVQRTTCTSVHGEPGGLPDSGVRGTKGTN